MATPAAPVVPAHAGASVGQAATPPVSSPAGTGNPNVVPLEVVRQPSIGEENIGALVPSTVLDEEVARESVRLDLGTVRRGSVADVVCFVCQHYPSPLRPHVAEYI